MNKKLWRIFPVLAVLLTLTVPGLAAEASFSDVEEGAWYAPAVDYCREKGLMSGVGDDKFAPGEDLSRAMAVTILYRAEGSPRGETAGEFTDVPEESWYAAPVAWAAARGITQGDGEGRFRPADPVTREELAVFFWRLAGAPEEAGEGTFGDLSDISPWAVKAALWAEKTALVSGKPGNLFDPGGTASRGEAAQIMMNYHAGQVRNLLEVVCAAAGVAEDGEGGLLVTDLYHKVVWQMKDGEAKVYAGMDTAPDPYGQPQGGYVDGPDRESAFRSPWAIAPFLEGWAVSDPENGAVRLIRAGRVETVNPRGTKWDYPTGLAADDAGNLYVADTGKGTVVKITPKGESAVLLRGLEEPMGLSWTAGTLYIAETGANRVVKYAGGKGETVAGSGEEDWIDGPAAQAAFLLPKGVAAGEDGTVYVADTGNSAVRRIRDGVVDTLLIRDVFSADQFPVSPTGLLLSGDRLYVADDFARTLLAIPLREK